MRFNFVVTCFGIFIGAGGLTHLMEVYTLWAPAHWWAGAIKLLTAVASIGTAIYLVRSRESIIVGAAAAKLSEQRRLELEKLARDLESRVAERTSQLELSQARHRDIFERVAVGLALLDLDGKWESVNPRLCEMLGYRADELLHHNFGKVTHPDDLGKDLEHIDSLTREAVSEVSIEKRFIHKSGRIVWMRVSVALSKDASASRRRLIASFDDITERKQLQEERDRLYELPNHLLCVLDENACFASVNAGFRHVLGYEPRELVGEPVWNYLHPDDLVGSMQTEQTARSAVISAFENRYRAKDGTYRWLRWTGTIIDGINYGAAVDITELKSSEQALRQSETEMRAALAARDQFLSMASHELKTPLTSLKLQVQLTQRTLRQKGEQVALAPERMRRFVDHTDKQVARLARLVEDMLDVARVQTGRLPLNLEPLDLCSIVKDVVERLSTVAAEARCDVQMQCDGSSEGTWDHFRVEQVLTNLLTNAFRYGAGKPVMVTLSGDESTVSFAVHDQGRGIAAADHDRIFQRFERAISSNEVSGLGLGLYIAKEIVSQHHGSIHVESMLGSGSTFTVRLPRTPGSSSHAPASPHEWSDRVAKA